MIGNIREHVRDLFDRALVLQQHTDVMVRRCVIDAAM
jgi:hypothetical protein